MTTPYVSILMGVYNGEQYLKETMDCIIRQTFKDWECVIVDDCSTDRTPEILEHYARKDGRIQIHRNRENLRIPRSLNQVIPSLQGRYVIRMDADDISRLDRVEKQTAFMDSHPELSMSCCKWFGLADNKVYPVFALRRNSEEMIKALFLFSNPIAQSAVIIQTEVLQKFLYNPEFMFTEDLDLWSRILESGGRIAVQDEYMLLYRTHGNQVTVKYNAEQKRQYEKIISRFYSQMLFPLAQEQLQFLSSKIYYKELFCPSQFGQLTREILEAARRNGRFSEKSIRYAACETLLVRRKTAKDKKQWMIQILKNGPFFATQEIVRRRYKKYQEGKKCQRALEQFRTERKTDYGKERLYWNV